MSSCVCSEEAHQILPDLQQVQVNIGVLINDMNMLVLHVTSGALRNLTQENNSYRLYVAAQGGLEALIKVTNYFQ